MPSVGADGPNLSCWPLAEDPCWAIQQLREAFGARLHRKQAEELRFLTVPQQLWFCLSVGCSKCPINTLPVALKSKQSYLPTALRKALLTYKEIFRDTDFIFLCPYWFWRSVTFLKADQGFGGHYPMSVFFMTISRLVFCLIDFRWQLWHTAEEITGFRLWGWPSRPQDKLGTDCECFYCGKNMLQQRTVRDAADTICCPCSSRTPRDLLTTWRIWKFKQLC